MGFELDQVNMALEATGNKGIQPAIDWLLNPEVRSNAAPSDLMEDCKVILVIRTDLGMSAGEVAAQCCHACLEAYKAMQKGKRQWCDVWEERGTTKITLKSESEVSLMQLQIRLGTHEFELRSISNLSHELRW
jgi:peptidyl-tRNA hydrolase